MRLPDPIFHLFHPHESNKHRPKILHPDAYLIFVVIIISFVVGLKLITGQSSFGPGVLGFASTITPSQVLDQTNQERQKENLPLLESNNLLNEAALAKAQHMLSNQYWAHIAPDGTQPWSFIKQTGYSYRAAGENLARDFGDTQSMIYAWMQSPTHKENIVNKKYTQIGIAVVDGVLQGYETTLVVQMFGLPAVEGLPAADGLPTKSTAQVGQAQIEVNLPLTQSQASLVMADISLSENLPTVLAGKQEGQLTRSPLFSPLQLTKAFFLGLIMLLIGTLCYDTFVMENVATVRMVGKNLAHIIMFLATAFLLIFFKGGIIG